MTETKKTHGAHPGLNFSFSGLKTAVATLVQNRKLDAPTVADIAASFEQAAVDVLAIKCRWALEQTGAKQLVVAGGVSANEKLRARLREVTEPFGAHVYFPRPEFSTDNGAMIAYAGWLRLRAGECAPPAFTAKPRWALQELTRP